MTRQELRDRIRKRMGETTAAFWTDAELNSYINTGCKDLAWRTKCLRTTGLLSISSCEENTTATVSNEYALISNFPTLYAVVEAYFRKDGEGFVRLDPTTREELDALNPSWQSMVGYQKEVDGTDYYNYDSKCSIPQKYYWSREEDIIGLYPPPNDDNEGTEYLKIYYTYSHTDLASDASVPTIPEGLHPAIVDFSVAQGLEDRGWGDRANDAWNKYYTKIQEYFGERGREREDEEIIMKPIHNLR